MDATFATPSGQLPEVYNSTPGDDRQLMVRFYADPDAEGDRCKIQLRGDPTTEMDEPVSEKHTLRFPELWHDYQQGRVASQDGTPLSEVTWLDTGTVAALHGVQVFTVEQLAGLNETAIEQGRMFGLGNFRERARRHLQRVQRVTGLDQVLAQNAQLVEQIQEGSRLNTELMARLEALEATQKQSGGQERPSGPVADGKRPNAARERLKKV